MVFKKLLLLLVLISFCPLVTYSQELSPVAFAYPMDAINIDGDLSDWTGEFRKYPIEANPFGTSPQNEEDFKGYFQTGYNLETGSLYFAVIVTDEEHVIDESESANWLSQDTYVLYLDKTHSARGSGMNTFFINAQKEIYNTDYNWDEAIKSASWDDLNIEISREGNQTIYECQVYVDQLTDKKIIGIDHVVLDKDSEGFSFVSWGKESGKSQVFGRLGQVFLMKENESYGIIKGQVDTSQVVMSIFPDKVRLTNVSDDAIWVDAPVDSLGFYGSELPKGKYKVQNTWRFFRKDGEFTWLDVEVEVLSETEIQAPTLQLSSLSYPDLLPEEGILLNTDFDEEKAQQLDEFIETYQKNFFIPGVSLALVKGDEIIYHKVYGTKNTYSQAPVDEKTLFEAASITKPVFAFLVCRLAEQGIIDLEKPLYEYLPFDAITHDERSKLITARMVLTHRTGFPNWANFDDNGQFELLFTPGTDFGYSGEGFEYLKRVVVEITGKDILTLLEEEVLNPIGLENTYFAANDYLQEVVSHGHFDNYPRAAVLPENAGMAYSMHTEAKDFTNFMFAVKNRQGLKPETYEDMFTFHTKTPDDWSIEGWTGQFGLGLYLEESPYGLVFSHSGNNGDFRCIFKMYEDLDVGFVIFTNSDTGDMLLNPLEEFLITGKQENSN